MPAPWTLAAALRSAPLRSAGSAGRAAGALALFLLLGRGASALRFVRRPVPPAHWAPLAADAAGASLLARASRVAGSFGDDSLSPNASTSNESTSLKQPPLRLSFEMKARSRDGVQLLSMDAARFAIALREVPAPSLPRTPKATEAPRTTKEEETKQDGVILDFARGRQYQHQRFFEELVCYEFDMDGGEEDLAAAEAGFREAAGEIFGVPLELYEEATGPLSEPIDVVGQTCQFWAAHRSWPAEFSSLPTGAGPGSGTQALRARALGIAPAWLLRDASLEANISAALNASSSSSLGATVDMEASFCVTPRGDLLAVNTTQRISVNVGKGFMPISEKQDRFYALAPPARVVNALSFRGTYGVAGSRCVDLTRGSAGARELSARVNDRARIARINAEAGGQWRAAPFKLWTDMTVADSIPSFGTEIRPLQMKLGAAPLGHGEQRAQTFLSLRAIHHASLPRDFDSRARWQKCPSIGIVRNQGGCGSCWAISAISVLADRFCITAMGAGVKSTVETNGAASFLQRSAVSLLSFSPEHLITCDRRNNGCGGGRLDDVWRFLLDSGVPSESCSPYRHCPRPTDASCGSRLTGLRLDAQSVSDDEGPGTGVCSAACASGSKMELFRAASAYAVAPPADVEGLQRELLARGPVQVAFFVFSDFHNYRGGVYFRTPAAFGPLGGHAVRFLGWGAVPIWTSSGGNRSIVDYWLAANSWSPEWGVGGFFKIRRGTNECGIETTPAAGLPAFA